MKLLGDRQRKLELQHMCTSIRLAAYNEDELASTFDNALITSFWLPALQPSQSWSGIISEEGQKAGTCNWELYKVQDTARKETVQKDGTSIQAIVDGLQTSFPDASPYIMEKTAGGWEKMMQDATLFLKNRSKVPTTVAALFEWVGQDESPFPSKRHKAKFVRDCCRLYEKCGGHREVHGVISDLFRIIAVRFLGYGPQGMSVQKTVVHQGNDVRTILTQFAFAQPAHLGFDRMANARWSFDNKVFEGDKILGVGLHGSVFSVRANEPFRYRYFVKTFADETDCVKELQSLRHLNEHTPKVPSVPQLHGVNADQTAILASPVSSSLEEVRGKVLAWKLAAKFVSCLESVHQAGLCHRDVRPSNMGFTVKDDAFGLDDVVLFDWASSCDLATRAPYSGTIHYAADELLLTLADMGDPIAKEEHDLESLVKTFWDITRTVIERPPAVTIEKPTNAPPNQLAREIQRSWQAEEQSHTLLKRLLLKARGREYSALRGEFGYLHGS